MKKGEKTTSEYRKTDKKARGTKVDKQWMRKKSRRQKLSSYISEVSWPNTTIPKLLCNLSKTRGRLVGLYGTSSSVGYSEINSGKVN